MVRKKPSAADDFSFGRLVAVALASGAAVLLVALPIVLILARDNPTLALIVACLAVVGMIVAIAFVSRRMLAGVQQEIDERRRQLDERDEDRSR